MEKVTIQFDADLSPLQDKLGQLKSSGLEQLSSGANEASSSIDKLSQSAKNMPMNVISQGFDEATTSIKENSQAITENVSKQQSMKAELRDLKNRLQELEDQGKDNTKEFEQMALRAGQLSDQIGDTSSRIRVLGDDSKYIKAVSQAIGAMASAYSVAQGASALFGSENKEVEKALLKVNAAMAIANGLQQINEVLQKQSTLSVVANTVAQRAYTFVVGESTGALKVFRVALAATGIGALIIGIWAAYEAMTAWNNKVQEAAETQKKLNEQIEKHRENLEKVSTESEKERNARKGGLDDMKRELQLLEARGATESAIYQQKRKILNEELGNIKILAVTFEGDQKKLQELLVDFNNKKAEIRALDAAHTKAVNAEIVKDTQKTGEANFNTLEADYQKEIVLRQEMLSKMNQDSAEARDLKKEIIDAELAYNLLILSTQYTNNQDYENKTKSLKLKATKDKEAVDKDYKQNSENSEKEFNAFMEQIYADNEQAYADSIARKQAMEKANRQAAKDQAIASIQTIANAEFEIDKANRDAKLDADIDALEQRKENELKNKDLTEAQKLAIQTKYGKLEAEAKKKAWEAEQDAKKKQAIINGALAITNIWATYGGTNPVLAGILTAASIISTATQVRVIDSQPVPKFAKGKNLDGYEGMAIIGEAGRELRLDSDGSMKMYNRATLDHVNADSIILPNNLTEALLKTNIPAMNLRNMNAVTKQNISAKLDIDYKKLARTLGEELKNSQKVSVNIDEKGFETRIMNGISERRVIDNRYKL
jgi:hypothetical protein